MPLLDTVIREVLVAAPAVGDFVCLRVRPMRLAQREGGTGPRPCLVYHVGDDEARMTFGGAGAHRKASVEVTAYADSHDDCAELAGAVKRALHGYAGVRAGVMVAVAVFESESVVEEAKAGQEAPVYVRTIAFRFLYREAV